MEIITGYTGENHVTSADDASLYRGMFGADDYVLEVGSKFAATIIDNNKVRVMDGDLVIQGHQGRIRANDYNEVTVDNGTPGQKRNDLIVARYVKNTTTGIESITLEVIKGIPGVTATDPDVVQGNLTIGATQRDYPLYRVSLNGLALENVTSLFTTIPNLKVLNEHLAEMVTESPHGIGRIAGQDYEEGIWTPTVSFGGNSQGITFGDRSGKYVRVGKVVTIEGRFALTSKGTSVGTATIGGLPFSRGVTTPFNVGFAISHFANIIAPANTINLSALISELSRFELFATRENAAAINLTDANFTNTSQMRFIVTYIIQ